MKPVDPAAATAEVITTAAPKKRTGPKPPTWADMTETIAEIKSMTPKERQASRTAAGELLVDIWLRRAAERLMSNSVRSQDLIAVASFLKANAFIVQPSKEGVPDALERLQQQRKADEAEEKLRLRRMAKAKEANEKRVEKFYAKQSGEPITPRLGQGPGNTMEEESIENE